MHTRRNHQRHRIEQSITVIDRMTGQALGVVANLSLEGLMIAGDTPLARDAIFQLTLDFETPVNGVDSLNIGVDCLWNSANDACPGLYWSGCQIIDLADDAIELLDSIIHACAGEEA